MGVLKRFFIVVCGLIIVVHSSNDVPWWPSTPKCQEGKKGPGEGHVTP